MAHIQQKLTQVPPPPALSVLRVTHIAYQWEQQKVVITLDETRFIGLIFQFLVRVKEILKSKLCLTSEKLFA